MMNVCLDDTIDILCSQWASHRVCLPLCTVIPLTERTPIETDTNAVTMITRDLYRDASTGIMQMCSCSAAEDEDTGSWGGSCFG